MIIYNKYKNKNLLNNQNYVVGDKVKIRKKFNLLYSFGENTLPIFNLINYVLINIGKIIVKFFNRNNDYFKIKTVLNIILGINFVVLYLMFFKDFPYLGLFIIIIYLFLIIKLQLLLRGYYNMKIYILGFRNRSENKYIDFNYNENLIIDVFREYFDTYKKYNYSITEKRISYFFLIVTYILVLIGLLTSLYLIFK